MEKVGRFVYFYIKFDFVRALKIWGKNLAWVVHMQHSSQECKIDTKKEEPFFWYNWEKPNTVVLNQGVVTHLCLPQKKSKSKLSTFWAHLIVKMI